MLEDMDYDYAISLMYRITGFLEEDFFALHVNNSGLWVWNADQLVDLTAAVVIQNKNHIECIEYASSKINTIKATPCGKFLLVGFPEASKVCFFSINRDEINLTFLEPKITVDFDSFECDDSLTVLLFNNL